MIPGKVHLPCSTHGTIKDREREAGDVGLSLFRTLTAFALDVCSLSMDFSELLVFGSTL